MNDVALSPDGQTLLATTHTGVDLWRTETGELLLEWLQAPGHTISCLALSGDGKSLATGGTVASNNRGWVTIWEIKAPENR